MTPGARVSQKPGETLESRVAALEHNLADLDQAFEARITFENERDENLTRRIDGLRADVESEQAEQDKKHRERVREDVSLQLVGTAMFIVGAILNGWVNSGC